MNVIEDGVGTIVVYDNDKETSAKNLKNIKETWMKIKVEDVYVTDYRTVDIDLYIEKAIMAVTIP